MDTYDPKTAPQPAEWLAVEEGKRAELCAAAHDPLPPKHPPVKNLRVHGALHAVVETQLAQGMTGVPQAMQRLLRAGLTRHEAVHAIGDVAAEFMRRLVQEKRPFLAEAYEKELSVVDPDEWRFESTPRRPRPAG